MIKTFGVQKDKIEHDDLLDKLLMGKSLNASEQKLVENNPSIHQDLEELKLVKAGVTQVHLEEKLKMLSDFEKEEFSNKESNLNSNSNLNIKPKRALPAILFSTILSLLIIGYFVCKTFDQTINVNKHFIPYPLIEPLVESQEGELENDQETENIRTAYKYYSNSIYKEAVPLFDLHLKENSNKKVLFYYGVSLIGSGDQKKAIEILNNSDLLEDKNYPTNFYLGLAYLDIDRTLAQGYLEQTKDYNSLIQQKAQQILSILK